MVKDYSYGTLQKILKKGLQEIKFDAKIKTILEEAESESVLTVPYFLKAFAYLHIGSFEEALTAAHAPLMEIGK